MRASWCYPGHLLPGRLWADGDCRMSITRVLRGLPASARSTAIDIPRNDETFTIYLLLLCIGPTGHADDVRRQEERRSFRTTTWEKPRGSGRGPREKGASQI
ncbi:hypothetical protein OH77DRAFT_180904 [Trametes cingulata]|nr:hypothetical protein OH77DRAFT_180904 [Trametes cingulata]